MSIEDIESPCQSICVFREDDISGVEYCIGCFRTVVEIQEWFNFTDDKREAITNALQHREEKLK